MPSPAPWENDTPISGGAPPMLPQEQIDMFNQPAIPGVHENTTPPDNRSFGQAALDALKAGGSGIAHGFTDLLFAPITLPLGGVNALGRLFGRDDDLIPDDWLFGGGETPGWMEVLHGGLDDMVYQPQNEMEQGIENVAGFLPASLIGPGGTASKLLRFGVAPGVASEAAGQVFDGTALEGPARVGGALIGGGLGMIGAGGANRAAQQMLPEGMTRADLDAATQLMTTAEGFGITLTWPEAIHQVTNGRVNVTDVQRFIESSRGGAPTMAAAMSERPGQVSNAVRSQTDSFGPQVDVASAGLNVQNAAAEAITNLRQRINSATEHLIQQAAGDVIHPMALAQLQRDPLFQEALRTVRNDPVYLTFTQGYPDGSVKVLNEIRKYLDDAADTRSRSGGNQAAMRYGDLSRSVRDEAANVSPPFGTWLQQQEHLRRTMLNPLEAGPTGRMAATPSLDQQVDLMFPRSPMVGSDRVVTETVQRVAARDPVAAQNLVRSYLEREFDDASRRLMGGSNQWSGGAFANAVAGSTQQGRNLQAAVVNAFPDGAQRWAGFQELLRVLEATGVRQRPGSTTQQNINLADEFSRGSRMGEAITAVTTPHKALRFVDDVYRRMQLTGNTRALAQIMTDPNAGPLLAQLLGARNIFEKTRLAGVLLYQAQAADEPRRVFGADPWGGDTPMLIPTLD